MTLIIWPWYHVWPVSRHVNIRREGGWGEAVQPAPELCLHPNTILYHISYHIVIIIHSTNTGLGSCLVNKSCALTAEISSSLTWFIDVASRSWIFPPSKVCTKRPLQVYKVLKSNTVHTERTLAFDIGSRILCWRMLRYFKPQWKYFLPPPPGLKIRSDPIGWNGADVTQRWLKVSLFKSTMNNKWLYLCNLTLCLYLLLLLLLSKVFKLFFFPAWHIVSGGK